MTNTNPLPVHRSRQDAFGRLSSETLPDLAAGAAQSAPAVFLEHGDYPSRAQMLSFVARGMTDKDIGARYGRSKPWAARLRRSLRIKPAIQPKNIAGRASAVALPPPDKFAAAIGVQRFCDVSAASMARETRLPGWWHRPTGMPIRTI
jgi:hypothetical protein